MNGCTGINNPIVYTVIIGKRENLGIGVAHPVVYSSTNREELIQTAIKKRAEMERNGASYGIFLGEMKQEVVLPSVYRLKELV